MDRFVREEECKQITGLGRTTRWELERAGKFPPRRRLSRNAVGWLESEIATWLVSRGVGTCVAPVRAIAARFTVSTTRTLARTQGSLTPTFALTPTRTRASRRAPAGAPRRAVGSRAPAGPCGGNA